MNFYVGTRVRIRVPVVDIDTSTLVDPATLAFRLVAPDGSTIPLGTYTWNGAIWTVSEAVIAVPSHVSLGLFTLTITIPYVNTAAGRWCAGWKTTANGAGFGEGSSELEFDALPSCAI